MYTSKNPQQEMMWGTDGTADDIQPDSLVLSIHPRNTNRLKFGNDTTAQFDEKTAVPPTVAAEKIWESIREPPT